MCARFRYGCASLFSEDAMFTLWRQFGEIDRHTFRHALFGHFANGRDANVSESTVPGLQISRRRVVRSDVGDSGNDSPVERIEFLAMAGPFCDDSVTLGVCDPEAGIGESRAVVLIGDTAYGEKSHRGCWHV